MKTLAEGSRITGPGSPMASGPIFLGGFMAAGKTSVGQALSSMTGIPFVDLDQMVESRAGTSVKDIFATFGEPCFRELESSCLKEAAHLGTVLVGLGGGVLKSRDNGELIRQRGKLVILDVSPEKVRERAANQPGKRPLLEQGDLESLWYSRRELYKEADLRVNTDDLTVDQVAMEVRSSLDLPSKEDHRRVLGNDCTGRVIVGRGLLPRLMELVSGAPYVVADEMTGSLFPAPEGIKGISILPRGEDAKTLAQIERLYGDFASAGVDRHDTVVAIGGGCVGDSAGFAAATWMRGLNLVQCPTTLLAQVDSSIGGKVGVNLPQGKNLVGAFHMPKLVLADVDCLSSMSWKDYRQGLAEVVKYGLGEDRSLFEFLEANSASLRDRCPTVLAEVVARCAAIKLAIVQEDQREMGARARLNLGHTVGHGLEAASDYRGWSHGDGVSVGMMVVTDLACRLGLCSGEMFNRLGDLLASLGLPTRPDLPWSAIAPHVARDKKFKGGCPRLVLPDDRGTSVIWEGPISELERSYEEMFSLEVN